MEATITITTKVDISNYIANQVLTKTGFLKFLRSENLTAEDFKKKYQTTEWLGKGRLVT